MSTEAHWTRLSDMLAKRADEGAEIGFWLRDDDAVEPTPALDRLLALADRHQVPLTLAVIPEHTGAALAERLSSGRGVSVAVHGWSHRNYASPGEKKQELGAHRPSAMVLSELRAGFERLCTLHRDRFVPMLVPPWNRIDRNLYQGIEDAGFRAISVFGPEKAKIEFNTHVDVMDWHGTRACRPHETLVEEIIARLERADTVGILTHHLVHDQKVDEFITRLFDLTAAARPSRWLDIRGSEESLIGAPSK